jgi:hypothetical protein
MSAEFRTTALMTAPPGVDGQRMDISGVNSAMNGIAAAQSMFAAASQAAANVTSPAAGSSDGSTTEAVQVAVLQQALQMERGLVNILA